MNDIKTVKVWDIFVRIFHWSLVIAFIVAYLTAEGENAVHIYAGYTVLGLIIFRVLWGIIGSKYARFSDFVYSPSQVIQYLKGLKEKNPTHYLGHNPAGGWMIVALLLSLFVVTLSGLKIYAIEEGRGPLAWISSDASVIQVVRADEDEDDEHEGGKHEDDEHEAEEEFWEEIHEISTNFTLFLIVLHFMGVVVSSRLHGENLVKAMITGKKQEKT
jgi:cytochrome b